MSTFRVLPTTLIYLLRYPELGNMSRNRATSFMIPVNPPELEIRHSRSVYEASLLGDGRISRPGARQPMEISWSSFFPHPRHANQAWVNYNALQDPWETRKMLKEWQDAADRRNGDSVLQLVVTSTAGFARFVTITDFTVRDKGGEPGDLSYDITLVEAKPLPELSRSKNKRVNPRPRTTSHVSNGKRTLTAIAKLVYKRSNGKLVNAIWNANKAKLAKAMKGKRTGKVPKGIKLTIPPPPK